MVIQTASSGMFFGMNEGGLSLQGKQLTSFVAQENFKQAKLKLLEMWHFLQVVKDFSVEIDSDINKCVAIII